MVVNHILNIVVYLGSFIDNSQLARQRCGPLFLRTPPHIIGLDNLLLNIVVYLGSFIDDSQLASPR